MFCGVIRRFQSRHPIWCPLVSNILSSCRMSNEITFVGYTCPICKSRISVMNSSYPPKGTAKAIVSTCDCGNAREIPLAEIQVLDVWRRKHTSSVTAEQISTLAEMLAAFHATHAVKCGPMETCDEIKCVEAKLGIAWLKERLQLQGAG